MLARKLLNGFSRITPRLIQSSASKLISAPPEKIDFFELLNQPRQFEINAKSMSKTFRQLQSEYHPDKYSRRSAEELEHAENWSALVNQAYSTLLNPMQRALYLLECYNDPLLEGEQPDLDALFLSEIMELNEELDELTEADIEEFSAKINENLQDLHEKLSAKFNENLVSEAKIIVCKMQYFHNLRAQLKEKYF